MAFLHLAALYVAAHWVEILAAWAAVNAAWKALPSETRRAIEERAPRLAQTFRFLYAAGPDVVKAVLAARGIALGTPKGDPA